MAGFETIVRPVVFPNIRPQPTPSLLPADDPTQGLAKISGSNGTLVSLTDGWNVSSSRQRPTETQRRSDEIRVYQKNDDGTVNKKNFVDMKVANKIWMKKSAAAGAGGFTYPADLSKDLAYGPGSFDEPQYYARPTIEDNIEVLNKDVIDKNTDGDQ